MKKMTDTELCDGCGQVDQLVERDGNEFCRHCLTIVDALENRPELLTHLCRLTGSALPADQQENMSRRQRDLPDVLDAVRYRTRDREQNTWYVSVSEMEGDPVEIFASTAFDRDQHLQSRISNLTTITRLISLILRHIYLGEVLTLDKTVKQLRRSSRQKNDLPDMLSKVLSNYRRHAIGAEKEETP
ncbi:hypothetical protein [Desulfofustis limnaeus]|jgi:hypothetical protein|uniref:ribonucleoside-diphosphate reductase n=1 Tax=Desulfofustis limnaeus TaxID=2740163 RepID=A0ABN6M7T0_9BACT|nr:hypothetical protein [Desulfofustis limnaeus]MDX9894460.1 hypothetical protein [Desulfofustis sp.]BDD88074.1 hypothetical protein DPPLL_24390 [Desulfofustis limnaeus]